MTTGCSASIRTLRLNAPPMSVHPAPRATRAIRAATAGSSALALGPNQLGNAEGEVDASTPVMARAHQRTRGRVRRRTWRNLAATRLDQRNAGATVPSFEVLACASVREWPRT